MAISKTASNATLIVGLGNPGEKYESTPHNAGFLVVEKLLRTYKVQGTTNKKLQSEIAEHTLGRKKIILAKPQTFMNASGTAIKKTISDLRLAPNRLWLIHDDVDLKLGQLKIVKNRGSAGHKGVEDVMRKLHTKDFVRFRIGTRSKHIPFKRSKSLMNKFVVSELTKQEQKLFAQTIQRCKEAVLVALEGGIEKATTLYNRS